MNKNDSTCSFYFFLFSFIWTTTLMYIHFTTHTHRFFVLIGSAVSITLPFIAKENEKLYGKDIAHGSLSLYHSSISMHRLYANSPAEQLTARVQHSIQLESTLYLFLLLSRYCYFFSLSVLCKTVNTTTHEVREKKTEKEWANVHWKKNIPNKVHFERNKMSRGKVTQIHTQKQTELWLAQ